MEIKLTLTVDEVNLVLGALREMPMKLVADLHSKILLTSKAQLSEQEQQAKEQAEKEKTKVKKQ